MTGNYLDIAIAVYLALYFYFGRRKRPLDAAYDLLILALVIATSLATFKITAAYLTDLFHLKSAYTNVIGFFMNAFILKTVFIFVFNSLIKTKKDPFVDGDSAKGKIVSGLLAILYGFATIAIIFAAIMPLPFPSRISDEISGSLIGNAAEKDPLKMNDSFRVIFGGLYEALLEDFDFLDVETGSSSVKDLGIKTTEVMIDAQAEERMLELLNKERTSRGLRALVMDEEARRAARDYGKYLFKNGFMSHIDLESGGPSDRMKVYEVKFMMIGENLARAHSVDEAQSGLMDSTEHRDNILRPIFSRVGIGAIDAGQYGIIFVQEYLD